MGEFRKLSAAEALDWCRSELLNMTSRYTDEDIASLARECVQAANTEGLILDMEALESAMRERRDFLLELRRVLEDYGNP